MKKMRTIIAAVLACATALSFTGCGNAKRLQDEDFFYDALDKGAKIDDDDCYHEKNAYVNGDKVEYMIYSRDGDNFYTYLRFKNADDALEHANNKFKKRFTYIEEKAKEMGKSVADMTLEEMEGLWQEAKKV